MEMWPVETIQEANDMHGTPLRQIAGILILGLVILTPQLAVAQQGSASGSLTATGFGEASGPADLATIYLSISSESAMMGPFPTASEEDIQAVGTIADALVAAGVDEGRISVISGPGVMTVMSAYGPAVAMVRFEIANPTSQTITEAVDAATAAADDARLAIGGLNVRLGSGDCAALERQAREAAVADARERAEVMGELTGLLPGETISVRDVSFSPESGFTYVAPMMLGCAPVGADTLPPDWFGPTVFDPTQEPIVTVYAQVELTYAASPSVLATPSG
jgi:uncharacterized protein YggE